MDYEIEAKINNFFRKYRLLSYKQGEILVRAGEDPAGLFFLPKGKVKVYTISKKADELILNVFKAPSFFPMSWAINETPNTYYYEAMEKTDVYRAPREEVIEFIKNNPDVMFDLLKRVFRGTDGLLLKMSFLMAGEALTKIITELLISTKRFGIPNKEDSKMVELKISEKEIASSSGVARETVSREIKRLKEKGLLTFTRSKLTITNLDKLEDELSNT